MNIDQNVFFKEATLRICSSLEIEKSLFHTLQYIARFIPALELNLILFDSELGVGKNLASASLDGIKETFPPFAIPEEALKWMKEKKYKLGEVSIQNRLELDPVASRLLPISHPTLKKPTLMRLLLQIEGKRLGILGVIGESSNGFTAQHAGLMALLQKPLSIALSNALQYREVLKLKEIVDSENRELNRELRRQTSSKIVGAKFGLRHVMHMVEQVARLNSPVLLLGETGVGKEIIANAIHYASTRKKSPFIKVNCGAIPESLIDSELFGHERGAFTGAVNQKRGRFERADKGTIFLDEIGELPPQAQVRMLRVLQQKEIERVGGSQTVQIDTRIIAATNRNLESMVHEGRFREDLWYRLNVFPITIPPLRHRKEDIPALVDHFIEQKSIELKVHTPPELSEGEMERLRSHDWPGNVRELENLIERALIYCRDSDRRMDLLSNSLSSPVPDIGKDILQPEPGGLLSLDEVVANQIRLALQMAKGKVYGPGGAAELLRINHNTLRSRMRKLSILNKPA
jgi:transcriptional regulator with GAF, ATPase, and Fis domain